MNDLEHDILYVFVQHDQYSRAIADANILLLQALQSCRTDTDRKINDLCLRSQIESGPLSKIYPFPSTMGNGPANGLVTNISSPLTIIAKIEQSLI